MKTVHLGMAALVMLATSSACAYRYDASRHLEEVQSFEFRDAWGRPMNRIDAAPLKEGLAAFLHEHSRGWVEILGSRKGPPGTGIRVALLGDEGRFLGELEVTSVALWFSPRAFAVGGDPGPGTWRRELAAHERDQVLAILGNPPEPPDP